MSFSVYIIWVSSWWLNLFLLSLDIYETPFLSQFSTVWPVCARISVFMPHVQSPNTEHEAECSRNVTLSLCQLVVASDGDNLASVTLTTNDKLVLYCCLPGICWCLCDYFTCQHAHWKWSSMPSCCALIRNMKNLLNSEKGVGDMYRDKITRECLIMA